MNNSKSSASSNPTSKKIPENLYRRHILRARGQGDWIQYSRLYAKVFGKIEALFLQDLINHASRRKAKIDDEGYFLCTTKFMERSMDWDQTTQKRMYRWFESQGIIKKKLKGIPPRKWIYLDIRKIEEYIDKYEDKGEKLPRVTAEVDIPKSRKTPPKPEKSKENLQLVQIGQIEKQGSTVDKLNSPLRTKHYKKVPTDVGTIQIQEGRLTPQSVAGAPSCVSDDSTMKLHKQATLFTPLQQACHQLAVKLENELRRHKKLKRPADLKKWARLFTDLANTLDGGLPYLTDMLNWYFTVIGEKYTPKLYSATSICHEFEKLVAARERAEEFSHKVTSLPETTSKETTDVPLSPEEEEVYESLSKLTWPKDSFRVLKYSIHKSYTFYELFKDRLYDYMKEHPTCYLAIELYHQFPGTIDYLNGYYEEVNRIVHNWKEWNGSYLPHVSLIDKILFRKHLYDIATEFGATVGECDALMVASGIKGGAR